jgi:hypothetical protein
MNRFLNCVGFNSRLFGDSASAFRRALRVFALALILSLCAERSYSQLVDLNQSIHLLATSPDAADHALAAELQHLCFDLVPTAFLNDGELDLSGPSEAIECIEVRASEVGLLDLSNPVITDAELIKIRVQDASDLASQLNPSLSGLSAHLVILAEFELEPASLTGLFSNGLNRPVYYSISIPR